MKIRTFTLLAVVLSVVLPAAVAADRTAPTAVEWGAEVAARQGQIELAVAPIRSRADLSSHLRTHRDSPLLRLPSAQRQRFIDGLVFTEQGLASYSYLPLEGALSVTDTYRILALFGAQGSIASFQNRRPDSDAERAMLEAAGLSAMAAVPSWRHGICVINGANRRCVRQYGSNCSRACGL